MFTRLSKDERRILCGRENCREQLGSIVPVHRWLDEAGNRRESSQHTPVLAKGYRLYPDGTFRMTPRAKLRRTQGRIPTFRRGPAKRTMSGREFTPRYNPLFLTRGAPAQLECARCGILNRLTATFIDRWPAN
jgi:hypothetical protein